MVVLVGCSSLDGSNATAQAARRKMIIRVIYKIGAKFNLDWLVRGLCSSCRWTAVGTQLVACSGGWSRRPLPRP